MLRSALQGRLAAVRTLPRAALRRNATATPATTAAAAAAPESVMLEKTAKPPSRIRAVFFGFLTGVTFSCGVGYVYLTDDITQSSLELQRSTQTLRRDVSQIVRSLGKIDLVAQDLAETKAKSASAADVAALQASVATDKEELLTALAQHRAEVWEAQEKMYKAIELMGSKSS